MSAVVAQNEQNEWTDPANVPHRLGTGDWEAFCMSGVPIAELLGEADRWATSLQGIERPWLCWNVDDDWCLVQQRLVREIGWTPVVGFDPRVGPPPLVRGAVLLDFNEKLRLPAMWLHFPLEFAFRFSERLAFWHADCLIRVEKMRRFAEMFAALPDGEMAAVAPRVRWVRTFRPTRYWEVLGCCTRGASRSQFENGCGWWMNFFKHPNTPVEEQAMRSRYYWDSGAGILFWRRRIGGIVHKIPEGDIAEGHFTFQRRKDYKRASPINFKRDLSKELSLNNDLGAACDRLGIGHLLGSEAAG
jgi:hypothetical protein